MIKYLSPRSHFIAVVLCGIAIVAIVVLCGYFFLGGCFRSLIRLMTLDAWSASGEFAQGMGPIIVVVESILLLSLFVLSVLAYISPFLVGLVVKSCDSNTDKLRTLRELIVVAVLLEVLIAIPLVGLFVERSDRSFAQQAHDAYRIKSADDAPQFRRVIVRAQTIQRAGIAKLSTTKLRYPAHSLVVYQGDLNDWTALPASIYHYACPSDWLASAESGVKLVVLISLAGNKVIGYYTRSQQPAYKHTYRLDFVDIEQEAIVATRTVETSDGLERGTLGNTYRSPADPPYLGDVVGQIRDCVIFGN